MTWKGKTEKHSVLRWHLLWDRWQSITGWLWATRRWLNTNTMLVRDAGMYLAIHNISVSRTVAVHTVSSVRLPWFTWSLVGFIYLFIPKTQNLKAKLIKQKNKWVVNRSRTLEEKHSYCVEHVTFLLIPKPSSGTCVKQYAIVTYIQNILRVFSFVYLHVASECLTLRQYLLLL